VFDGACAFGYVVFIPLTELLLTLSPQTVSSTHRYPFPALAAILYATLLGPAFHYLWLYAGSGNANFFYAITLVWNLALLILETDFVYAALRDEWEGERPEAVGKVARQI
jgi:phosphatidylinositol glycan class U